MSLSSMGSSSGSFPGGEQLPGLLRLCHAPGGQDAGQKGGDAGPLQLGPPLREGWAIFHCLYRMAGHLLPLMWDQQVYYGSIKDIIA